MMNATFESEASEYAGNSTLRYARELQVLVDEGHITPERKDELLRRYMDTNLREGSSVPRLEKSSATELEDLTVPEREVSPWKTRANWGSGFWRRAALVERNKLRSQFISKARAGLLTPQEVLEGYYLLFVEDGSGALSLAHLRLQHPASKQVELHNWRVWSLMLPTAQSTYGPLIQALVYPLFPPGELDDLNECVLYAQERTARAGCPQDWYERLYRLNAAPAVDDESPAVEPPVVASGSHNRNGNLINGGDGNLGGVEERVLLMQQSLEALSKALRSFNHSGAKLESSRRE